MLMNFSYFVHFVCKLWQKAPGKF